MVDYAGFRMPLLYKGDSPFIAGAASIKDSAVWTRTNASMFDVGHMCSLRWTGKDAIDFLESVTVADIHGLGMNQSTLSVIPNAEGGVIDDTMITKCPDHIYQVINAGCGDKDLAHFDEQLGKFGGDVNLDVAWETDRGLFALQGRSLPVSARSSARSLTCARAAPVCASVGYCGCSPAGPKAHLVMQQCVGGELDLSTVLFGGAFTASVAGVPVFVTRCGYTGEDGFEINCPKDAATLVWQHLLTFDEVRLAGLGARDMLRMEAGLCLYGFELDATTTPAEAALSWTVGAARRADGAAPFVGSDVILAQLKDRSLIKEMRCGMMTEGPPARAGAAITTVDGEPVGKVTSGCSSPCLGSNISMGYVQKPHNKKGTDLQVVVRGKSYPAKVTGMPFVPTSYFKG